MKALLKTRCGCSREIDLPNHPLAKHYEVPMMQPLSAWFDPNNLRHPDDPLPIDRRMFELDGAELTPNGWRMIYHESYTKTV